MAKHRRTMISWVRWMVGLAIGLTPAISAGEGFAERARQHAPRYDLRFEMTQADRVERTSAAATNQRLRELRSSQIRQAALRVAIQ